MLQCPAGCDASTEDIFRIVFYAVLLQQRDELVLERHSSMTLLLILDVTMCRASGAGHSTILSQGLLPGLTSRRASGAEHRNSPCNSHVYRLSQSRFV